MTVKIVLKPPVPVLPEVDHVEITLSPDEARSLSQLCGRIGGGAGTPNIPTPLYIDNLSGPSAIAIRRLTDRFCAHLSGRV